MNPNKGRCKRCDYSCRLAVYSDGAMHNWCRRYDNFCQGVARNCDAPPNGLRLTPNRPDGQEEA